jgi:hypothetical protein
VQAIRKAGGIKALVAIIALPDCKPEIKETAIWALHNLADRCAACRSPRRAARAVYAKPIRWSCGETGCAVE